MRHLRYVVLLIVFTCSSCSFGSKPPATIEADPSAYMLNLADVLGTDWQSTGSWLSSETEDYRGKWRNLLATGEQIAQHNDYYLAFIRYNLFEYTDAEAADERFFVQARSIFYTNSSSYIWDSLNIREFAPNAERRQAECTENIATVPEQEVRCAILLQYNRYIVYLNIWRVRNSNTYLTMDNIYTLIERVDEFSSEVLIHSR